jgi:hypothetical protein
VAYVFTFPECALRTSSKAWWLAGGANEFQATAIGAEIELSHFRMSCATGVDCVAKCRYLFFSFFQNMFDTPKISEMTASVNDHTVCQGHAVGNSPQVPYSYLHFFFYRVDTLYSRTRAQFLTLLDVVRALTRLMSLTLLVIKTPRRADSFVIG